MKLNIKSLAERLGLITLLGVLVQEYQQHLKSFQNMMLLYQSWQEYHSSIDWKFQLKVAFYLQ